MGLTLHLGVIELPYVEAPTPQTRLPKARKGKQRPRKPPVAKAGGQTTGDVADILERKYHVMETFYEVHEEEIADDFAQAMAGALEDLLVGAPPSAQPYAAAESALQARFKTFLESKEMDELAVDGVPTKASLRGVNHRLKIKRGGPRPSFIDTGLYESSFVAWIERS